MMNMIRWMMVLSGVLGTMMVSAQAAESLCEHPTVQALKPTGCLVEPYRYGKKPQDGQLVRALVDGAPHFFLSTTAGELVDLGAFNQRQDIRLMRCVVKSLGFDSARSGRHKNYKTAFFGQTYHALRDGEMQAVLEGSFPFTGVIRTKGDGSQCEGKLSYQDDIYSWKEAETHCKAVFQQDVKGDKVQPQVSMLRMYQHVAGYYYVCIVKDQGQSQSDTYFYRVDLEKNAYPGTVLMRKASTEDQKRWWRKN